MSNDEPLPPRFGGSDPQPPDEGTATRAPRPPGETRTRTDPLIGKVLDQRYRVHGLIAKGGMGRVYRAEQAPLGRTVAVKVLDVGDTLDDDQEFRRRFIREAEVCSRLSHPNTVRVFDHGQTDDGVLYIAMEHLVGRNLFQAIQTDAPMDALRVVRIGRQVAASLREAHGLGLIHRDLKPSNILLTQPGGDEEFVKVVDFGLAKEIRADAELTRGDALVGSPSYMSPEQVRSAALDERSDIYSLGVLLYACLCGRPPFSGATSLNVLMGHLNQPPPPMETVCPSMLRVPSLEAVVMRCLSKTPAERYPDMDAMLRALQDVENELSGVTRPPAGLPTRPAANVPMRPEPSLVLERPGRGRAVAAAVVGGLAVIGLVAWLASLGEDRVPPPGGRGPAKAETGVGGGERVEAGGAGAPQATGGVLPAAPLPAPEGEGGAELPQSAAGTVPAAPLPPPGGEGGQSPGEAGAAGAGAAGAGAAGAGAAGAGAAGAGAATPPSTLARPKTRPAATPAPSPAPKPGSDVRDPWEEH